MYLYALYLIHTVVNIVIWKAIECNAYLFEVRHGIQNSSAATALRHDATDGTTGCSWSKLIVKNLQNLLSNREIINLVASACQSIRLFAHHSSVRTSLNFS